ncbi:hypothetical protein EVA_16717 [gut metagenome]|uniref:Uncharacterized protein n=1 Tax=gut metagenome TaxID=749906 RepID=J9G6Q1_9ZZZZ
MKSVRKIFHKVGFAVCFKPTDTFAKNIRSGRADRTKRL